MPDLLFDHLVGAKQDRLRHRQAERLCGLEVDGHLVLRRQLNGQLRRLRAAQNAIDIGGGATPIGYLVDSVGEQTAVSGKDRLPIDRRYVVSDRRRHERRAMDVREQIRQDDEAASRLARKSGDGRFDLRRYERAQGLVRP